MYACRNDDHQLEDEDAQGHAEPGETRQALAPDLSDVHEDDWK